MDTEATSFFNKLQLSLERDYEILLCCHKQCQQALSSNHEHISNHLRGKHCILTTDRKRVVQILASYRLLDPDDVALRPDGSDLCPHLPVLSGFACKFCEARTISKQVILRHITKEHEAQRMELRVRSTYYGFVVSAALSLKKLYPHPYRPDEATLNTLLCTGWGNLDNSFLLECIPRYLYRLFTR
jgi:hypothetical protein